MSHIFTTAPAEAGPQRLDRATLSALFAASHLARWTLEQRDGSVADGDWLSARIGLFAGVSGATPPAIGAFRPAGKRDEAAVNLDTSGDGKRPCAKAGHGISAAGGLLMRPGSK